MSTISAIPLAEFGLLTVVDAAHRLTCSVEVLQKRVRTGQLPAVVIGAGRSARFLLRESDLAGFAFRPPGAPKGPRPEKKKDAPNARKTGTRKKSRK